jgi:ABC-type molybdate transport system substrate-binding protein
MYMIFLVSFMGVIMVFQKSSKFRKISFMLWPVSHAFTNNCNATPGMILQRLSAPSLLNPLHYFQQQFKQAKNITFNPQGATLRQFKKA